MGRERKTDHKVGSLLAGGGTCTYFPEDGGGDGTLRSLDFKSPAATAKWKKQK